MTVSNSPVFPMLEADRNGQDVYEVVFDSWGEIIGALPAADYTNCQYPGPLEVSVPVSVAAIAIGPRSTVDRCWVTYDLQKRVGGAVINPSAFTDRVRRLSIEAPLLFAQEAKAGNTGYATTSTSGINPIGAQIQGYLYVAAAGFNAQNPVVPNVANPSFTTSFPSLQDTTVLPPSVGAATGAGVINLVGVTHVAPLLHLVMYLKPIVNGAPTKRFPQNYTGTKTLTNNTETGLAQIPVFGRKRIVLSYQAITHDTSFRVSGVRCLNQEATLNWETTEATTAVVGNTTGRVVIDNPCMDYLLLWATSSDAGGNALRWSLTAYD